jgi:Mrp family chromosome partitioning ATPase/capsular polysaccharide biosynthesis protein
MTRPPNQLTLRELLRPITAHWILLSSVIVVAVAASLVYSATREPTYTAAASIAFQDESRDLGLVGLANTPIQTADQLASAGAQTIIQPVVAAKVKDALRSQRSVDSLTNAVSAAVQPSSNLVVIQAHARTPGEARDLAQAFATQGAAVTNAHVRGLYAAAFHAALKQLRRRGRAPDLTAQAIYSEQLSRLQVLSTIATPAQVVKSARLPSVPSSPRPLRDALLAAVLGLVLGILAAYVRDSFDRRLRHVNEIDEQFGLPMLGHVRGEALGRSPRLNHDRGVASADWELFRILRRNLDFLDPAQQTKSVAITSSLPEEGKSTVASFVAFTSAAAGKRTLLMECDLRRPVFADRLGIESSPGLSDLVTGRAEHNAIFQVVRFGDPMSLNGAGPAAKTVAANSEVGADADQSVTGDSSPESERYMHALTCISAGTHTQHPVEILRSERFGALLKQVRDWYDLVVLDTPPLLSVVDTLELLPHVDSAVICVRVGSTTRQQARSGRAALKRLPERPTGIVVTGTSRATEAEYGYYGYYA